MQKRRLEWVPAAVSLIKERRAVVERASYFELSFVSVVHADRLCPGTGTACPGTFSVRDEYLYDIHSLW